MSESLSMDEARLATIAQLAALLISSLAVDKKSPYAVQPRRGRDLLAILWILWILGVLWILRILGALWILLRSPYALAQRVQLLVDGPVAKGEDTERDDISNRNKHEQSHRSTITSL